MVRDVLYSSDDVMEFFFCDELLDRLDLHFLDAFLQLDLVLLDFFLHLLPCHRANVRVEVDFRKVSLENILFQQELDYFAGNDLFRK